MEVRESQSHGTFAVDRNNIISFLYRSEMKVNRVTESQ